MATASRSRTRIETRLPRNSTGPSAGETHRSNAGFPVSPTVTFTYVRLSGRMATRFCSSDAAAGELVAELPSANSSLVTGFALRTSGSPVESTAKALRVSGGPIVWTGEAIGAAVAPAPPLVATAGLDPPEATAGVAIGELCAVDSPRPGASRCTLRKNFMAKNPITKTSTPKMSGIGETRLFPPLGTARRRTTGVNRRRAAARPGRPGRPRGARSRGHPPAAGRGAA